MFVRSLPSFWNLGMRVCSTVNACDVHGAIAGIVTKRRHLPIWMTSGNDVFAGTLLSVKVPSAFEVALMSGLPLACVLHCWQLPVATPSVNVVMPCGHVFDAFGT